MPVELHPLLRWRMARAAQHAWKHVRAIAHEAARRSSARCSPSSRDKGPLGAARSTDSPRSAQVEVARSGWWEWSDAKSAIECLFWSGQVTSAGRRGFERLYDLPERVLPARRSSPRRTPSEEDAQRALVERGARALGVATETDLRDYYRLPLADARRAIAELVEEGALGRSTVEGWAKPGVLASRGAEAGRRSIRRPALLSPFDSLIWARERTERMFGMKFRLEIYIAAAQARARLLRAAVPARRRARRARRSQGGPSGRHAAGAGGARRAAAPRSPRRRRAGRGAIPDGSVARARRASRSTRRGDLARALAKHH